jgi:LPS sulfotransferase NodH
MSKLSVHYFVCMVQRTGSNMLCEALSHTGLAGKPGEYFVPAFESAVVHGHAGFEDSSWAREHGITAFPQFVEAVLLEGRTANGVFGAKLPWNALASFHAKLRELPGNRNLRETELLPLAFVEPRFIHLQRRDRVRQAVSWALAAQTGHFASHQAIEAPAMEPRFDLDLLDGLYRLISEGCQG